MPKTWCTWENVTLACTKGLMGLSRFLKTSGTLGRMRLLVYQRFYGFLWILKKPLVHFRGIMLLYVPEVYSFRLIFRGGTDF